MQTSLTPRQIKTRKAVLFAICLFIFTLISIIVWPILSGQNIGPVQYTNAGNFDETPETFHIQFHLSVPANSDSAELSLQSIIFPYNFPEKTCALFLSSSGANSYAQLRRRHRASYFTDRYGLTSVCKNEAGGVHLRNTYDLEQNIYYGALVNNIPIETTRPTYFYPFDKRVVGVYVKPENQLARLDTSSILKSGEPILTLEIDAPEWDKKEVFQTQLPIDETARTWANTLPFKVTNIELQRPLSNRILTVILLLSILTFIILSIFINELGTFLEVAVGILLGLWGIQTILVPDYITGATIIDALILTLYVLFAFAIFIRFLIKPAFQKLSTSPNQEEEKEQEEVILNLPNPLPVTFSPDTASTPANNKTVFLQLISSIFTVITAIITFLHFIRKKD